MVRNRRSKHSRTQAREACRIPLRVPGYPEELPVAAHREEIRAAIDKHQVIIVAGETGSGKTTQLPKICLELARGTRGLIGCTQPRRVAALTVAARVAEELASPLGQAVGYQIRFNAKVEKDSYIKFMTDGVLLAETRSDRLLRAYDTLIIDEAHERSLNIDFILGYLKTLLPRRPDLKVIISSATMDVEGFSEFFSDAPVLNVEGRTFPVTVRYAPPREEEPDLPVVVGKTVGTLLAESDTGDILVFLTGERDIRETGDHLVRQRFPDVEVLPLYGRLTTTEQKRVFKPGPKRRVVLATNVAETSVTVPRIHYVVDAGLARIRRYNPRTQVERLQIERISRASADQRKGRCGRIAPGTCVRLYAEEDLLDRTEFTDPEIKRSSLASVILQMKDLNLGEVESFPFLDPPAPAAIRTGYDELLELGALAEDRRLTRLGRNMAHLPVEPRIARMLLAATREHALDEVSIIAAALSVQDPRLRPLEKQEAADAAHRQYMDDQSDFITWIHLWRFVEEKSKTLPSNNQFRKWCKDNFLSYRRIREWRDVRRQLLEAAGKAKHRGSRKKASPDQIHRSVLSGLLSRIGKLTPDRDYQGTRGIRFHTWPGSGLFKRSPEWVVAGELVETSRLFGRCMAAIDPLWVERLAGDRCKRTYTAPHWDPRSGVVRAFERVTVYGLSVVERRRVHFGPIDPARSRELLIRDGLVRGELQTRLAFLQHNQELVKSVEEEQHRVRRADLLVDEESLFSFYDRHLAKDLNTTKALEKWYHEAVKDNRRLLFMTEDDVRLQTRSGLSTAQFPGSMTVEGVALELTYRFDPGHDEDGVSCTLPIGILSQLPASPFEWLVPGLLPDKVAMLLRGLPRSLRRELNPIPDTVEACLAHLSRGERPLLEELAAVVLKERGVQIDASDWRVENLPSHLRMNFLVQDEGGKVIAAGRDLALLQERFQVTARKQFVRTPKAEWERDDLTAWDFGDLPKRVDLRPGATETSPAPVWAYPCLVDRGKSVSIRVYDTPLKAEAEHRRGCARLFLLSSVNTLRNSLKRLPLSEPGKMIYASRKGTADDLRDHLMLLAADRAFLEGHRSPRDEKTFRARLAEGTTILHGAAYDLAKTVDNVLLDYARMDKLLTQAAPAILAPALADMREQLEHFVYPGFLLATGYAQTLEIPRYIKAMAMRYERLRRSPDKDQARRERIRPLWRALQEQVAAERQSGGNPARFYPYRWLLEELRVSVFAQELGTAQPVSEKRLAAEWHRLVSS